MKTLRLHQTTARDALANAIRGIINLPTGTGKTLIQSRTIVEKIRTGEPAVYVILSPRILLSDQLMADVRNDLDEHRIPAQYCVVHSGRYEDTDDISLEHALGMPHRQTLSGVSPAVVKEAYRRACAEGVSLVISGTYHSAERIQDAEVPVDTVFCDEAHYLVGEQFAWIPARFPADNTYFFTATMRDTASNEGLGMNNPRLFGEVLYSEIPATMIAIGEMVRPRLHFVTMSHDPHQDEGDGLAVIRAFEKHSRKVNVGAKLLVVAKDGSVHLDRLSTHVNTLRDTHPNLTIFDISSKHKPRINGVIVTRNVFFVTLRNMSEMEEAIIIHHNILAEGIDVTGITGVFPLIPLADDKFRQTVGRATRLNDSDRERLYNGTLLPNELTRFVKPYAWVIVPVYGMIGEDLRDRTKQMVAEMRSYGFNPSIQVTVSQSRGGAAEDPFDEDDEDDRPDTSMLTFMTDIMHELEDEEKADRLVRAQQVARQQLDGASIADILGFVKGVVEND